MSKWEHIDRQHSKIIQKLKAERTKQGLSQEKLAEKSGLSIRAVGMIESGERKPTLYNILRICDAMEIKLGKMAIAAKVGSKRGFRGVKKVCDTSVSTVSTFENNNYQDIPF